LAGAAVSMRRDEGCVGGERDTEPERALDQIHLLAAEEPPAGDAEARIEAARSFEEPAPEGHIRSPDPRTRPEGKRQRAALLRAHERQSLEEETVLLQPGRRRRLPFRQDPPPDAVRLPALHRRADFADPVRVRRAVVAGESEDPASSLPDPAVSGAGDPPLRLEVVTHGSRRR